jgi:hypothetical protein
MVQPFFVCVGLHLFLRFRLFPGSLMRPAYPSPEAVKLTVTNNLSIHRLYEVEREQRAKDMSPCRFLSERGKAAAPVLESFKKWLDAKVLEIPPSLLFAVGSNTQEPASRGSFRAVEISNANKI